MHLHSETARSHQTGRGAARAVACEAWRQGGRSNWQVARASLRQNQAVGTLPAYGRTTMNSLWLDLQEDAAMVFIVLWLLGVPIGLIVVLWMLGVFS